MIKGFIGTSLIDFPGNIASVVFFGGCNYRCPFCQNSWLVAEEKMNSLPTLNPDDVLRMITIRAKMIDGVVFSGGEPTLYPSILLSLLSDLKKNDSTKHLKTKLDTNGSHPVILKELISRGLLNYIAMDLKTSPSRYDTVTGVSNSFEGIRESLQVLSVADIPSEVRTTCVPGLVDKADLTEMAPYIAQAKRYILQGFRPQDTLDESYLKVVPYTIEYVTELKELVQSLVPIEVTQR